MKKIEREQIADWVEKELDDTLTSEEFAQLQQVLTDVPEARELYLDLMHQHAHLQLQRAHLSGTGPLSNARVNEPSMDTSRPATRKLWLSFFVALAGSLLLLLWWNTQSADSSEDTVVVAQITDSSDAEWGECTCPTAIGSKLSIGRLKIERGLTTIRFSSGAEVTLESPAELEIETPLRCRLLAGTAVVEVPESAHGFTLATPTAVAIDHGTAFSVTVDHSSQVSSIEVLDGEVEVQHVGTDASRRLKQQERVVASSNSLSDSDVSSGEAKLSSGPADSEIDDGDLYRITTADGDGRDSSISRSQSDEVMKNSRPELVLIKNPFEGYERFSRKGYFAFDLGLMNGKPIKTAKFVLTLRPSGLGYASKVGDCEFVVYGLSDESGDDWSEEHLNWETAPANRDGATEVDTNHGRELGRFTIQRGRQHGQVWIEGEELVDFVNADTNGIVTLILVRATKEEEPGGLVHGFANRSNSFAAPPALLVGMKTPE